jgi:hydroxymethylbilane synthase
MIKPLRIATRKSPLALKQTQLFAKRLQQHWPHLEIELVAMTTQGDQLLDQKLQYWGGKGLFVKELENALLEKRADIAVHSMKDVPAQFPQGLVLACICKRDNPYDALISLKAHTLKELPLGTKVGTASLRRQAQLLAIRPDLEIHGLRGNINTRLQKLKEQQFDAIILACAGLERMEFTDVKYQELSPTLMLPACGQGAIGIECRENDTEILQLLAPLQDPSTTICVETERHVNALLGGHCHVPIAIFAELKESTLTLQAKVLHPSGQKILTFDEQIPYEHALQLAEQCAHHLIAQGAMELIKTL